MLHPNSATPYEFPFKLPWRRIAQVAAILAAIAVVVAVIRLIPVTTPEQRAHALTIYDELVAAKPPLGSLLVWQKSGGVAPLVHNCNGCIATYRTLFGDRVPVTSVDALFHIERVVRPDDPDYAALAAKYLGGL